MVKPRSDEFVLHGITSVESLVRRLRVTHSDTCTYDKPVHDSRYPAICNCGAALKNEAANKIEALLTAIEAAPHSHGCPNRISGNKFAPGPWQCNCWKAQALKDTKE